MIPNSKRDWLFGSGVRGGREGRAVETEGQCCQKWAFVPLLVISWECGLSFARFSEFSRKAGNILLFKSWQLIQVFDKYSMSQTTCLQAESGQCSGHSYPLPSSDVFLRSSLVAHNRQAVSLAENASLLLQNSS